MATVPLSQRCQREGAWASSLAHIVDRSCLDAYDEDAKLTSKRANIVVVDQRPHWERRLYARHLDPK
jgi:hypothetical protein